MLNSVNTMALPDEASIPDIIMYTVKDIQKIFKCSQAHAYELVNANGFPSIRIGAKILIEKTALQKWITKNLGKSVLL